MLFTCYKITEANTEDKQRNINEPTFFQNKKNHGNNTSNNRNIVDKLGFGYLNNEGLSQNKANRERDLNDALKQFKKNNFNYFNKLEKEKTNENNICTDFNTISSNNISNLYINNANKNTKIKKIKI